MKKILLIAAIVLAATSCKRTSDEQSGDRTIRFYRDTAPGVEYILYCAGYGCSITPRLNPDGTLYIKEE